MQYRCYLLNMRSAIEHVKAIEAATDRDALDRADALLQGSGFYGVEVWDRSRRVEHGLGEALAQIRRWRMKAEEIRTTADGFSHTPSRDELCKCAETYEALARAAEARLRRRKDWKPEPLREQSRLALQACRRATTIDMKREHASRAFALAQLAEQIEREEAGTPSEAVS